MNWLGRPLANSVILALILLTVGERALAQHESAQGPCDIPDIRWKPLPYDEQANYHPNCKPEFLYSWLTSKKIIDKDDSSWPLARGRAAFFSRTPLATFMYGTYPYRVKLKPGLRFKLDHNWREHIGCAEPKEQLDRTIYVLGNEYVICSMSVIESWSYGMPQHLQEMLNEKELVERVGAYNVDGFMNPNALEALNDPSFPAGKQFFMGYSIHDARHNSSKELLEKVLKTIANDDEKGRVFYPDQKKYFESGPEADLHFKGRFTMPFSLKNGQPSPTYQISVRVTGASVNGQNVTNAVAAYCDTKGDCVYKISETFLNVAAPLTDFQVTWKCCEAGQKNCTQNQHQIDLKFENLEDTFFAFGCGYNGDAVYSKREKYKAILSYKLIKANP